ncbi:PAS domain S-box protein [Cellulophaga baltica]|uniref:PAS domain-containing sensor histidine kinase n=1 Tax=Cellulophaga TaxID=104264 RepID=UPI001C06B23C|nr:MULTISPECIES: PAS domain-containing sensor histidine kinase [Cellulophaga]MBU2996693.1 PAS domain S-box protein [Cellulophaga baltica]MDO6768087.1 PAS domain S-box protein [Cellulophaga sp. 1_MG-2023]
MDSKEITLLKKALARQVKARKQAERILEEKSKELYDVTLHLKEANNKLEETLTEKSTQLDGVFVNLIDPYVVMDLTGNVIKMNSSAKEFLQADNTKEKLNLGRFIHKNYIDYTHTSFKALIEVGIVKNYRAKLVITKGVEKYVEINASLIYDNNQKPIGAQGVIRDINQETEIKKLLSEQRKQLDIIVQNSPLAIVLVQNRDIIKVNNSFIRLLGYSESELKNIKIDTIAKPEDPKQRESLFNQLEKGDIDNFTITYKYIKKAGGHILGKTAISAVRNQNGSIDYKVGLIEDITKTIEAEKQLVDSKNRLTKLIANLHTGILVEDENRKITLTNEMFHDLFDVKINKEGLKGYDCVVAIEKIKHLFKNPEREIKRIEEVTKNKNLVLADEIEMIDGRIIERDYIPIFNSNVYAGHLWTYNDVTIARNYKINLESEKEKYSSIIANMNLGLIEIDNNQIIQLVNQSFCKISGYSEEELIGKKATDVIQVINKDLLENKIASRRTGKSDSYEIDIKHIDGTVKHWLVSAAPKHDVTGKVIGSIGIHFDITEQKTLENQKETLLKELEQSNKGLQEYAHIVSHDLKSPLRSINALCSWLNEDYKDVLDDPGKYNLNMMQEKVEAMDSLIDGILKYSTINSENIVNTSVDVNEVIKEITDIIFIPDHVEIVVTNKLPTICADRTKIHQLIQNFLSNAVVHIEREKGLVEIGCIETPTHWEFSVKDNGVGIPKEYHEKIFKIFQSVGNKERSTGIGLSIVKKIIDLYEGKVWLESEIGVGTTFFFSLKK